MRRAALDFGSNTVGYLVADPAPGGLAVVERDSRFVRLAEDLARHGVIGAAALRRCEEWLGEVRLRLDRLGVQRLRAVGTECPRRASNRAELVSLVRRVLDAELEIISGDEEASLTFAGVRWGYPGGGLAVLDIGGGSTELAVGEGEHPETVSLPLGAVTLTSLHGEDRAALAAAVRAQVQGIRPAVVPPVLTVLGGTGANVAMMDQDLGELVDEQVEGHEVALMRLDQLIGRAAALTPPQRVAELGVPEGRADVLVAGMSILRGVLEHLGITRVRASRYSLRHGVARRLSP